jgi:hypothetical protein
VNLDAERGDLVDLAVELPAVAAVDVREHGDDVLDLAVLRLEHDHALRIDAGEHCDTGMRPRLFGDVRARVRVVDVAAEEIVAVGRDVRDVTAERDLVKALDRGVADVVRLDAVELAGELFLAQCLVVGRLVIGERACEHDGERQSEKCFEVPDCSHGGLLRLERRLDEKPDSTNKDQPGKNEFSSRLAARMVAAVQLFHALAGHVRIDLRGRHVAVTKK